MFGSPSTPGGPGSVAPSSHIEDLYDSDDSAETNFNDEHGPSFTNSKSRYVTSSACILSIHTVLVMIMMMSILTRHFSLFLFRTSHTQLELLSLSLSLSLSLHHADQTFDSFREETHSFETPYQVCS
jgi:hypothetical protein